MSEWALNDRSTNAFPLAVSFCDMMPSDKNPCLNKVIKWYQGISQQPSQVSLGECWIKCLGKAHQKALHNPHFLQKLQVTVRLSSLYQANTEPNLSGCFSQAAGFLVWYWSILDGRKVEDPLKVS